MNFRYISTFQLSALSCTVYTYREHQTKELNRERERGSKHFEFT